MPQTSTRCPVRRVLLWGGAASSRRRRSAYAAAGSTSDQAVHLSAAGLSRTAHRAALPVARYAASCSGVVPRAAPGRWSTYGATGGTRHRAVHLSALGLSRTAFRRCTTCRSVRRSAVATPRAVSRTSTANSPRAVHNPLGQTGLHRAGPNPRRQRRSRFDACSVGASTVMRWPSR
jgi:hypothetical protein